jgi:hypothetical protein
MISDDGFDMVIGKRVKGEENMKDPFKSTKH